MNKIQTVKVKRKLSLNKKGEIVIDLNATDICGKKEFVELYDKRVQDKVNLENQMEKYKEFLTRIKSYEDEKEMKELVKKVNTNQEFAQKVFAIMQKKQVVEQLQVWEKALEGMEKELSDLGPMYKRLREKKEDKK